MKASILSLPLAGGLEHAGLAFSPPDLPFLRSSGRGKEATSSVPLEGTQLRWESFAGRPPWAPVTGFLPGRKEKKAAVGNCSAGRRHGGQRAAPGRAPAAAAAPLPGGQGLRLLPLQPLPRGRRAAHRRRGDLFRVQRGERLLQPGGVRRAHGHPESHLGGAHSLQGHGHRQRHGDRIHRALRRLQTGDERVRQGLGRLPDQTRRHLHRQEAGRAPAPLLRPRGPEEGVSLRFSLPAPREGGNRAGCSPVFPARMWLPWDDVMQNAFLVLRPKLFCRSLLIQC